MTASINKEEAASPRYWARRFARHAILVLAAGGATAILYGLLKSPQRTWRISMATAYVGLALVALSLALGPWNVLRGRPNPVSFDLRRDVGLWGGVFSVAHVVVGLQVHMGGRFWEYFVHPLEEGARVSLRFDPFGLMNHTGLVATLGLLVLMLLSNDLSLARLGSKRWKRVQQINYVIFVGVIAHGLAYQFVEERSVGGHAVLIAAGVTVLALQVSGHRRVRRSHARH